MNGASVVSQSQRNRNNILKEMPVKVSVKDGNICSYQETKEKEFIKQFCGEPITGEAKENKKALCFKYLSCYISLASIETFLRLTSSKLLKRSFPSIRAGSCVRIVFHGGFQIPL